LLSTINEGYGYQTVPGHGKALALWIGLVLPVDGALVVQNGLRLGLGFVSGEIGQG
jgi:hypothetical protein